jgi:UPF0716 protein FxsA
MKESRWKLQTVFPPVLKESEPGGALVMNPAWVLLLLFVGAPLIELYFMIKVGSEIGALPTVLLVVFTAVLGGILVRIQGLSTMMRVRGAMERGEVPAIEMLEGALLLTAGFLLLLPGFITDALGFALLVPPLRRYVLVAYLKRAKVISAAGTPPSGGQPPRRVIEGEFQRHDDT